MSVVRKTVTLTRQQDDWIAPDEGEESGAPERFDFAAFKRRKAAEHG